MIIVRIIQICLGAICGIVTSKLGLSLDNPLTWVVIIGFNGLVAFMIYLCRRGDCRMKFDEFNELLKSGNMAQLEKLNKNKHKNGFDNINILNAIEKIIYHVSNLEEEEYSYRIGDADATLNLIRNRAANIANFAHMIILKCDKELSKDE